MDVSPMQQLGSKNVSGGGLITSINQKENLG